MKQASIIDLMVAQALKRLRESINRSAGQHARAMRNTDYSTGQPRPKEKQK